MIERNSNRLCSIPDAGVFTVDGPDAEIFLQAQLTNDISALDTRHWQRTAYCNPKGRVIAIMEIARHNGGFWVITHADLLEPLIRRLSMYILRAKVELKTLDGFKSIGIYGDGLACVIRNCWPNLENTGPGIIWQDEVLIRRIEGRQTRLMLTGRADKIHSLSDALEEVFTSAGTDAWRREGILDGVPRINGITTEQFIPQALNLDLIDGVSFNKGCYPGQEIVARVHFLGKTKQRMYLAYISGDHLVNAGDPVYRDGQEQRAGTVIDTVRGETGYDALISVPVDSKESYRLNRTHGGAVERCEPPYSIDQ